MTKHWKTLKKIQPHTAVHMSLHIRFKSASVFIRQYATKYEIIFTNSFVAYICMYATKACMHVCCLVACIGFYRNYKCCSVVAVFLFLYFLVVNIPYMWEHLKNCLKNIALLVVVVIAFVFSENVYEDR